MKNIANYINESNGTNNSEIDKVFKRIIGNNKTVKDNFIDLVEYEFINCKYPLFKSKKELLEQWADVDEAIDDANTLYYELEEATEKDDFSYNSFYNVKDLIRGYKEGQITELIYTILKNKLK